MLEFLYNKGVLRKYKVSGSFIKKTLQHRCFPVKFVKFLRKPILKNICERMLLTWTTIFEAPFFRYLSMCVGFLGGEHLTSSSTWCIQSCIVLHCPYFYYLSFIVLQCPIFCKICKNLSCIVLHKIFLVNILCKFCDDNSTSSFLGLSHNLQGWSSFCFIVRR